ncbi:MAG: Flp pilus assembly protein CpaB [Henriciella sp.]
MRNVSILIFFLALVLGVVAVLMTRNYVNSQRLKSVEIEETATPQEMGTLVITTKPLNFGDEIAIENLKEVSWPTAADARPEKSFSKISDFMTGNRRVAIRSIGKNEPIVADKISGFGYRATLSQVVAPEKRAVAVRLTDVTGVGGFVLPGDRVDVLYTRDDRSNGDNRISHTKLIVRDVLVLAVDQLADESSQGAVIAKTATLEVSTEQAQKISLAARVGELDLMLRPMVIDGQPLDDRANTISLTDLKNENLESPAPEPRVQATSRARVASRVPTVRNRVNTHSNMQVTRGTETSQSRVMKGQRAVTEEEIVQGSLAGGPPMDLATASSPSRANPQSETTP